MTTWLLIIYFTTYGPDVAITPVSHEFYSALECQKAGNAIINARNMPSGSATYQCVGVPK